MAKKVHRLASLTYLRTSSLTAHVCVYVSTHVFVYVCMHVCLCTHVCPVLGPGPTNGTGVGGRTVTKMGLPFIRTGVPDTGVLSLGLDIAGVGFFVWYGGRGVNHNRGNGCVGVTVKYQAHVCG